MAASVASQVPPAEEVELHDCGICFTPIDRIHNPQGFLNSCAHIFCSICITAWGNSTNTCPQCKQRFTRITTTELEEVQEPDGSVTVREVDVTVKKIRRRNLRIEESSEDEEEDEDFDEENLADPDAEANALLLDGVVPGTQDQEDDAHRRRRRDDYLLVTCKICEEPLVLREMVSCEARRCDFVAHAVCLGFDAGDGDTMDHLPDRWYCEQHQQLAPRGVPSGRQTPLDLQAPPQAVAVPVAATAAEERPQPPPAQQYYQGPPVVGSLGATGAGQHAVGEVIQQDADVVRAAQTMNGLDELRKRRELTKHKRQLRSPANVPGVGGPGNAPNAPQAPRSRKRGAAEATQQQRQQQAPTQGPLQTLEEIEEETYQSELRSLRDLQQYAKVSRGQEIGLRPDTWDCLGRLVIPQRETKEQMAAAAAKRRAEEQRQDQQLQQRARATARAYTERVRQARAEKAAADERRALQREQFALQKLQQLIATRRGEYMALMQKEKREASSASQRQQREFKRSQSPHLPLAAPTRGMVSSNSAPSNAQQQQQQSAARVAIAPAPAAAKSTAGVPRSLRSAPLPPLVKMEPKD